MGGWDRNLDEVSVCWCVSGLSAERLKWRVLVWTECFDYFAHRDSQNQKQPSLTASAQKVGAFLIVSIIFQKVSKTESPLMHAVCLCLRVQL